MSGASDNSTDNQHSKLFSSQEFMSWLNKQVDISKLEVVTKSGDRITASFNGFASESGDGSSFRSLDALKSLTSIDSVKSGLQSTVSLEYIKAPSKMTSAGEDHFTSRDWTGEYATDHVDVTYTKCFAASSSQKQAASSSSSTLPPKKRKGKTDWYGMYANALSPLVEAASLAQPQPLKDEEQKARAIHCQKPAPRDVKASSKQSKRKPRKIIPENKEYVEQYTSADILFGRYVSALQGSHREILLSSAVLPQAGFRGGEVYAVEARICRFLDRLDTNNPPSFFALICSGGRSNHHPGNKLYRDIVTERQPYYRSCDKNEKTKVAQGIVDSIMHEHNGRFLELEKETNRWYIVPNIVSRR